MMIQPARLARVLLGGFCLGAILLAQGCGSAKGTVSGKVTYQGKTVKGGTVHFHPKVGSPVGSPIEEDGSYTIRNMATGPVNVTVETESFRPPMANIPRTAGGPERQMMQESLKRMNPDMADPERAKRYVQIPESYRDHEKTSLTYDVKSGKQEHDIELK